MRVSGAVLHGNLIMFDKNTNTRWLQETGKAIDGENKGLQLAELNQKNWTANVRWDVWQKQHPESQLLFCDHCENQHAQDSEGHDHEGHDHDSQDTATEEIQSTPDKPALGGQAASE